MKAQLCDRWMTSLALVAHSLMVSVAIGAAPGILVTPFMQSPVAAAPGKFLILAGSDMRRGDQLLVLPAGAGTGRYLPLQFVADTGDAAMVLLPQQPSMAMPLTAKIARNGLAIGPELRLNVPRPLWFHVDGKFVLTVVGHNLQAHRLSTRPIALLGQGKVELGGVRRFGLGEHGYWLQVDLGSRIPPGNYRVAVQDRNGNQHEIVGQTLQLDDHPSPQLRFQWSDVVPESCRTTGLEDRSGCLQAAVNAVAKRGGGLLVLGPGRTPIGNRTSNPDWLRHGIVVPPFVSLTSDRKGSVLVWRPSENGDPFQPALTLMGNNQVSGIQFTTVENTARSSSIGPLLQLGRDLFQSRQAGSADQTGIADVRIFENQFESIGHAIADSGRAILRLSIEDNEFESPATAIYLGGNRYVHGTRFGIEDSAILRNRFRPGRSIGGHSLPIATELGAARRVLFLDNVADGSLRARVARSPSGTSWRAGFFWHLQDSVEMLLVAENRVLCVDGRNQEGEGIALDNNVNTFGLNGVAPVAIATPQTVSIERSLRMRQHDREIRDLRYYVGHWLRIVDGIGIGQSRRIVDVQQDLATGRTMFVLDQAWDVVPRAGLSSVVVARQYWQVMIVGNYVDQRPALCGTPEDTSIRGGSIALWGHASDIVIAGNRMLHTDGIVYHQAYSFRDIACSDCNDNVSLLAMIHVLGNRLDGERSAIHSCSDSGIRASFGSTPSPRYPPPVLGFGIHIANNSVREADSAHGGAIVFPLTWHGGSGDRKGRPPILLRHVLVERNRITDRRAGASIGSCGTAGAKRIGINLPSNQVSGVVIHGNNCDGLPVPVRDASSGAIRVCIPSGSGCGCTTGKQQVEQPDPKH